MITAQKGRKHPRDIIYNINGHLITYRELATICVQICKNEDNIYPKEKGFKGGDMFRDFMVDCMDKRDVPTEVLKEYKLC